MNIKSHCKIDRYEKAKCAKSSVVEQKIKDLVNLDLGETQKRSSQYFHGKTLKKKIKIMEKQCKICRKANEVCKKYIKSAFQETQNRR